MQDLHDVFCYVFRKTVDINSAMLQNREEQSREDYTDGVIPTKQGYGNSCKAVVVGKAVVVSIVIPHHIVDAYHACQGTRYSHRENDLFANRDATILRSRGIATGGPYLLAPLCAPQKQLDQPAGNKRQYEGKMQ